MKKLYTRILLCMGLSAFAQTPEIKTELPTILPPSPTVAALMRFEEIPVNNYTGIPDINIPIFSTPTRSKDISLSISLNYHPASAGASETASDIGLGWSMLAGGSISRTVRGIPDEHLTIGKKSGIYRTELTGNPFPNPYYDLIGSTGQPSTNSAKWNEFLWNAQEKGIYDTEHDLWQYNFLGYSGRFIIKKNASGHLEVTILDLSNNLKIVNKYNNETYIPTGFEIYDDKGYKYVFDIAETTDSSSSSSTTTFSNKKLDNVSPTITYISAFHLTGVYDCNQKLVVGYNYNEPNDIMREVSVTKSQTVATSLDTNIPDLLNWMQGNYGDDMQSQDLKFEPLEFISTNTLKVNSKKVKRIDVNGIAKIYLDYESGRLDQSLTASAYRVKSLTVKTWDNTVSLKKIELFHSYVATDPENTRMFLDRVEETNFTNAKKQTFKLYYNQPNVEGGSLIKDYWGYFTLRPNGLAGTRFGKATNPKYCTIDILQKMELPTGGSILFDFESNEYSNIGSTSLTNFDKNPLNWNQQASTVTLTTVNTTPAFFTITESQEVIFDVEVNTQQSISDWRFLIYDSNNAQVAMLSYVPMDGELPPTQFSASLPAGSYKVAFRSSDLSLRPPYSAIITANYRERSGANKKYLFGGGVRIGRIGFFDRPDVPQNYYDNPSGLPPAKEKKYDYRSFSDPTKSSGSLVFGVPVFEYDQMKQHNFEFRCANNAICQEFVSTIKYRFITDFNNLQVQRTKGSDVGYQNATVKETDNGRTEYTYHSPIDKPENEDAYTISYPFFPSENIDYMRGQLIKEVVFDNTSKTLSQIEYSYDFVEEAQDKTLIGIRPYYSTFNCPWTYKFANYDIYLQKVQTCPSDPTGNLCAYICGAPIEYITYKKIYEAYGWAQLARKTSISYFYEGINRKTVTSFDTFTYNPVNKEISTQTTSLSPNEILKTEFYYHTGNSPFSQNRISEIERVVRYRNSELLSTSKNIYSNSWGTNASYFPHIVQSAVGSNTLETEIRYNNYDEYGNILEMELENGLKTSFIWGYNKSQPLAKLENIAYSDIPANLITSVQNASDAVPYNETDLIVALKSLVNNSALADAMVTFYTYKPLVGISTITDPKGDFTRYVYDSFGRLNGVYDNEGNLLSENVYHYRTQN